LKEYLLNKKLFNRILIFFAIANLLSLITLKYLYQSDYSILIWLSFLLALVMTFVIIFLNKDIFSPLFIFSLMYFGYALGGYYYSTSEGFGKFLGFMDIDNDTIVFFMELGLLFVIINYLFFTIGYLITEKKQIVILKKNYTDFWIFFGQNYKIIVIPFLVISLSYWYYLAVMTAGGLINLIIYFQAFPHQIKESGLSTLPYHLYYAGIFIWLLGINLSNKKITYLFIIMSFIGLIMNLSQGRITLSVTYVISQLIFIALLNKDHKKKIIFFIIFLLSFAFVIYFMRIYSNYLFIGKEFSLDSFSFLNVIIGGGNVADLQQLVIIFTTFDMNNILLGQTFFDWVRNTFGSFIGLTPSSIGLIIKQLYIPSTSGAPTPGAIGELYANFLFTSPMFMFFIGSIFAFIRNKSLSSGHPFVLLIYSIFLSRFVFVYPKVDSTMMSNFFWGVAPSMLSIAIFYLLYKLVYRRRVIENKNI